MEGQLKARNIKKERKEEGIDEIKRGRNEEKTERKREREGEGEGEEGEGGEGEGKVEERGGCE
jgi:hypothetical protein